MTAHDWSSLILAAGLGTRMKSDKPKVLHAVAGRSMLSHTVMTAMDTGSSQLAIVIGPDMEAVETSLAEQAPAAQFFIQSERLGTADAVLSARAALSEAGDRHVLVLYGDTPLIRPGTLTRLLEKLQNGAAIAILGFEAADPTGYGRILTDPSGRVYAIREQKDASDEEREVRLCNSGVMGFRAGTILPNIEQIRNQNAKGEYYLTDAVEIACREGQQVEAVICGEDEVLGINDRVQLAAAEKIMQGRLRDEAMREGVTMIAPDTVTMSFDTRLGRDVVIEPNVYFGPGVAVEERAQIRANSYLEQARVREGAIVGPFAHLRPGADIGASAKIGNFVEVKNARIEAGAKVNHLAYVGDAQVGARANLGAGTIICNYDGFTKSFTEIGEGAFIGSNSALVAPLKIGAGAYIGSGSVIVKDVEPDALAVERSQMRQIPGWAKRNREKNRKT